MTMQKEPQVEPWTRDRLLRAWGEFYAYGSVQSVIPPRDRLGLGPGVVRDMIASLYVEGFWPHYDHAHAVAFELCKPALVHVYAHAMPVEAYTVPRLPGQSRMAALVSLGWAYHYWTRPDSRICASMLDQFHSALDSRLERVPFRPSGADFQ